MKTGLGLYKKYRLLIAYINLFRFKIRKLLIGFDVANQLLTHVDKYSVKLILKRNGATIGENCDIETGLVFHNCEDYSNLNVGKNCHIGKNCFFDLRDKIIFEDNIVMSMQCTILTHIDLNKSEISKIYSAQKAQVYICENSYIGAKATLFYNLTLNKNCFVAAGSVVTKDVPPFTMVGGVPAKYIKRIV